MGGQRKYEMELTKPHHNLIAFQMGDRDKKSVQGVLRMATEWIDGHSEGATLEEVEDQLDSKFSSGLA
jgi:hypothetical protein